MLKADYVWAIYEKVNSVWKMMFLHKTRSSAREDVKYWKQLDLQYNRVSKFRIIKERIW